jgi:hypothetical protein
LKSEHDALYVRHYDKENNKVSLETLSKIWKGLFPVDYYISLAELKNTSSFVD